MDHVVLPIGAAMLPQVHACPDCNRQPVVKVRLFRGFRAECGCGVAGPFVGIGPEPEANALAGWARVVRRQRSSGALVHV